MDYVVGSVAALITGNVTPSRPRILKRALTPKKHQPSPNVTPKSEICDRSIFLSPTLQKKKAIVKKSPKRIFQSDNLDATNESENSKSPKVDKVKKQLRDELTTIEHTDKSSKKTKQKNEIVDCTTREHQNNDTISHINTEQLLSSSSKYESANKIQVDAMDVATSNIKIKKQKRSKNNNTKTKVEINDNNVIIENISEQKLIDSPIKKKKKSKLKLENMTESFHKSNDKNNENETRAIILNKNNERNKKKKDKKKKESQSRIKTNQKNIVGKEQTEIEEETLTQSENEKQGNKYTSKANIVNPNAISNKDSDSEHESDNEIYSETEENNKELLEMEPAEESSDEENTSKKVVPIKELREKKSFNTDAELKQTIFVGNVPFSKKCKKEIKKIFSKHGEIDSVRIRNIPVKDPSVSPKLAVIKNELHPKRTTVNVYVKYTDISSAEKALSENNTELNGYHLRVSRSDSKGADHDPRYSIFVGNIPFALEDDVLRETFQNCGEIESVRIIRDRKTNAGKGFGYVNFASKDGVELALLLSEEDLTIKNKILRVKRCTQMSRRHPNKNIGKNKNFLQNKQGKRFQTMNQGGKNFGQRKVQNEENKADGAYRRITNKRVNQEPGDGPPNKRRRDPNQPVRQKKTRKEFVGMTAEKKKKHNKFNKDHKKKKALREILTKS